MGLRSLGVLAVAFTLTVWGPCPTPGEPPPDPASFAVNFEGSVVDRRGTPAVGADIRILNESDKVIWTGVTDSKGAFRCIGLTVTPGDYTISARSETLRIASSETITVRAGQTGATFTTTLRLEPHYAARRPSPPPPPPPPAPVVPLARPPVAGEGPGGEDHAVVKVFYATDRERLATEPIDYGPHRGSGLVFGRFDVSIPRDHRMASIERPSIWRFEFREDPAKHFVIVARKEEQASEFYEEVGQAAAQSARKEAFVFIHGYNVGFEDAVYRTAQLAYDLGFDGAPILYSWPSNGQLLEYTGDLNNNDWTVPHLEEFLESIATEAHVSTVHLIAHSMGNRALSNALHQIAIHNVTPPAHFREVVLTAPDIDADTFKMLAESIEGTADRVTLYASSHDRALEASKRINGYPRAGDAAGSILVLNGMDTIDASAVETDFLGHSYFGDRTSVLSDILKLFSDGTPPDHRSGLQRVSAGPLYYWKVQP